MIQFISGVSRATDQPHLGMSGVRWKVKMGIKKPPLPGDPVKTVMGISV